MSVWAFCVHRQINRAGGVTDPNNLVHYSRHFQMLRKVLIFPKSSLGPSCLLQVCDPRWALLSRGGGGGGGVTANRGRRNDTVLLHIKQNGLRSFKGSKTSQSSRGNSFRLSTSAWNCQMFWIMRTKPDNISQWLLQRKVSSFSFIFILRLVFSAVCADLNRLLDWSFLYSIWWKRLVSWFKVLQSLTNNKDSPFCLIYLTYATNFKHLFLMVN